MKRLALLTGVILLTLTMVLVVWQLRDVILMFLLALAIAAALSDPVDVLHSRAWPRALAILVVYVVVFGSLILLVVAITVPLLNELDPLAQAFLIQYTELQTRPVKARPWHRMPCSGCRTSAMY